MATVHTYMTVKTMTENETVRKHCPEWIFFVSVSCGRLKTELSITTASYYWSHFSSRNFYTHVSDFVVFQVEGNAGRKDRDYLYIYTGRIPRVESTRKRSAWTLFFLKTKQKCEQGLCSFPDRMVQAIRIYTILT